MEPVPATNPIHPKRPAAPPLTWRERGLVLLSRWRIEAAMMTAPLALLWMHPTRLSFARGLPIVLSGVALRIWARGHLDRRGGVSVTGPYHWMRHPLYAGSFLIGLGFATMDPSGWLVLPFTVLYVVMYVPKALREEAHLRRRWGDAYAVYARDVGPLWPRRVARDASGVRFSWRKVQSFGEWKTWLGVAAALLFIYGRAAFA